MLFNIKSHYRLPSPEKNVQLIDSSLKNQLGCLSGEWIDAFFPKNLKILLVLSVAIAWGTCFYWIGYILGYFHIFQLLRQ